MGKCLIIEFFIASSNRMYNRLCLPKIHVQVRRSLFVDSQQTTVGCLDGWPKDAARFIYNLR